ncbi:MAG TPA: PKD domain-containing protein [Bacteroidia bacterium]|nr:PKD domain-containing protein [Bacteroidia bacterium]HRS59259.1 PKD domain-containing protein [Bacteroidia bacterium]HRU67151.1 PKD domain-containing protein [Bacteroidia bacterium]
MARINNITFIKKSVIVQPATTLKSIFAGAVFFLTLIIFQTSFTASAQNTIFFESFNGSSSLPTGWTQIQVTGSDVWTINNGGYYDNGANHPSAAYSGTRNAFLFSPTSPPSSNTRKLVTPVLDLGGLTNVTLTFYEARLKWGVDKDQLKIYYRTSATGSWSLLATYSTETTGWVQRTVSLPNPGTTYYVAFEGIAQYGYGICLDDIKITATIGNDAALTDFFVENKKVVKAVVKNMGTNTLTSFDLNLSVNQGSAIVKSWTGSLTSGNSTTVTITTNYNFPDGVSDLKVWTSNPNSGGDGNKTNDTLTKKYTLIKSFPYQQGFENSNLGYWTQSTTDDMDWTRYSGSTPSATTGPSSAYEGTYYIYTEASGYSPSKKAEIYTVDFEISAITNPYLEFWCHMYGNQMGELHLDIDSASYWKNDIMTPLSGNKGNQWFKVLVDLNNYRYLNKIRFRAITGAGFLSDLAVDDVKILDIPNPKLGNDIKACVGDTVNLQVDTGYGYTFIWKKSGLNDTLSVSNKLKVSASGTYIVLVSAPYGYTGTDTIVVDFGPFPSASFNYSVSSACLKNNLINFTNKSVISSGNMTYLFSFGDNTDTNTANVQHTYPKVDNFIVRLIATSDYGCKDTFFDTVSIYPDPVAKFSVNNTYQCRNSNNYVFTNQSTLSSGSLSYLWHFGDMDTSNVKNPSHSYSYSDTFTVSLIAISDKNCRDTIHEKVYVMAHPKAAFQINDSTQCLSGNQFSFTNQSTIPYGNLSYYWDFGNKGTSTATHPGYSFQNDGIYQIKLIASSTIGCKDSLIKNVYVYPMPQSAFSVSDTSGCLNGNMFYFTDLSTIKTGTLSLRYWYFGDGSSSVLPAPTRTYMNDGKFTVKLLVESDQGCQDSIEKKISVFPSPTADFTINNNSQCLSGNSFYFLNQSSIKSGTLTFQWNPGDNNKSDSINKYYKYSNDGTFDVKLIAVSEKGCKDSITRQVVVNPMPVAGFSINKRSQCIEGNNYSFSNQTALKSGSYTSNWFFGDGSTTQSQQASHQYSKVDTFKVKLVVVSDKGCSDSIIKEVYVKPMPKALFTVNDSMQCLSGNQFDFQNLSDIQFGLLSYFWEFNDQTTSDNENPSKTYSKSGKYNVKLMATSAFGCKDSFISAVIVFENPEVFLGNDTVINDTSTLLLDAGGGFVSYLWHDSSTSRNYFIDTSENPGMHTYFVTVTDSNGCSGTDSINIEIKPLGSLHDYQPVKIKVYPNPAKNYINIEFPTETELCFIRIFSAEGREIFSEKLPSEQGTVKTIQDLSFLKAGIYYLQIQENERITMFKIIKRP